MNNIDLVLTFRILKVKIHDTEIVLGKELNNLHENPLVLAHCDL